MVIINNFIHGHDEYGPQGPAGPAGPTGSQGPQGPEGPVNPWGACPPGMKHDKKGSARCKRTGKGLNTRRNCTLDKNDKGLPLCSGTIGSNSRPTGIGARDANTPTIATGQLSLKNRLVWANRNDYDAQANQMNSAITQDVRYDANTPVMTYGMWASNESAPKICPNNQKTCDKSKKVHPFGGFNPLVMDKKTVSIQGGLNVTGGKSKHNPHNWRTHFNWHTDGNNYIRGDTELRGNIRHYGSFEALNGNVLNVTGGTSVHNPGKWRTHFNYHADNKNYIRGDTEMRGNMGTIGDVTVGGNLCMPNAGCISSADFKKLITLAK